MCVVNRRGLNPPHRVKSISMASFSVDEMEFIKCRGNDVCMFVIVSDLLTKLDTFVTTYSLNLLLHLLQCNELNCRTEVTKKTADF